MKNLVLFGAGGLARETVYMINDINSKKPEYNLLGFIVEESYYQENTIVGGYPVLGTEKWIIEHKDDVFCCCAIGTPGPRARIQKYLESSGVMFESLISPWTVIRERSTIGKGCIITSGHISVDCKIGDGVLLNGMRSLGHDSSIGNFSCIMGNVDIAGWCKIGEEVLIGGHAYIIPHRKIGDRATVAAGSIVFSNVKAGTTVLGNPAKRMKAIEDDAQ